MPEIESRQPIEAKVGDGKRKKYEIPPNVKRNPEKEKEDWDVFIEEATLYHGSATSGIKEFKVADDDTIGEGVYLTSRPRDAIGYASVRDIDLRPGQAPILYEVELKNLRFVNLAEDQFVDEIMQGFFQFLQKRWVAMPDDPWYIKAAASDSMNLIAKKKFTKAGMIKFITQPLGQEFSEYLRSLGYDGLIGLEGGEAGIVGDHDSYAVFNP